MSADNWATCPKCLSRDALKRDKAISDANDSYGKISAEEFIKLRDKANAPLKSEPTLREDYEVGIDRDGVFCISYRGHCDKCGLTYKFEKWESVPLVG